MFRRWLWIPLCFSIACKSAAQDQPDATPENTQIPAEDREHFEQWKGELLKTCTLAEVMPSLASAEGTDPGSPLLDAAVLSQRSGGRAVLAQSESRFALLGAPRLTSRSALQETSFSVSTGGSVVAASASAQLQEGACIIRVNGEEIYRTELYAAVPVRGVGDDRRVEQIAQVEGESASWLFDVNQTSYEAYESEWLTGFVRAAMQPPADAHLLLAEILSIDAAVARELFPADETPLFVAALRLDDPAIPPFATEANVVGPAEALANTLTGAGERDLHVQALIPLQIDFNGARTSERLPVALSLRITNEARTEDAIKHRAKLSALRFGNSLPSDAAAARSCTDTRFTLGQSLQAAFRTATFSTSFSYMENACAPLVDRYIDALLADADLARRLVAHAFAQPASTKPYFAGWDRAAISLLQAAAAANADLSTLFGGGNERQQRALQRIAVMRSTVAAESAMRESYEAELVTLGASWSLYEIDPGDDVVQALGDALAKVGRVYPSAMKRAIANLAKSVTADSAGMQALTCAIGMDAARIAAFDAVKAKPFTGVVAEIVSAEEGRILERCPSVDALQTMAVSLDAIAEFASADSVRGEGRYAFGQARDKLLLHAYEERWTKATFQAMEQLVAMAVFHRTSCVTIGSEASLSERSLCADPELRLLSARPGGYLDPAFLGRYASLASSIAERYTGWASERFRFYAVVAAVSAGWDTYALWTSCSPAEFDTQSGRLLALLSEAKSASSARLSAIDDDIMALTAQCGSDGE